MILHILGIGPIRVLMNMMLVGRLQITIITFPDGICVYMESVQILVLYSVCCQNHIVLRFWYSIAYNFHFV